MMFREIRLSEVAERTLIEEIRKHNYVTGPWVKTLESQLERFTEASRNVAVSSGTMAIKIALDCLGVGKDDVVIVPDITFLACASVVHELGAVPVFVDVDPETLLMDEQSTVAAIGAFGSRVKAIMPVRLAGEEVPAWVWGLRVPVIVDSAHSMAYHDQRAFATCYSFHPSKIVSGAEGGAIATNDHTVAAKARRLRLFGFKEGARITRGEVGYKANMTNISACIISFNLGQLVANLANRTRLKDRYNREFGLNKQGLGYYMVTVQDPDALCKAIPAVRHYPETLSEQFTGEPMNERAKWIADHLVSIPFHEWLVDNEEDVAKVCAMVKPQLITYGTIGSK